MGIHHTYKSQRGERSLLKKQKLEELRKRSYQRKQSKQEKISDDVYVVPETELVTLDILTNPGTK